MINETDDILPDTEPRFPSKTRVMIESPYGSDDPNIVTRNLRYARACLRDSLSRGEAPFASHLLYTQVLDDRIPEDRLQGIHAAMSWLDSVDIMAVYTDLGLSHGMKYAIEQATNTYGRMIRVEFREIPNWTEEP